MYRFMVSEGTPVVYMQHEQRRRSSTFQVTLGSILTSNQSEMARIGHGSASGSHGIHACQGLLTFGTGTGPLGTAGL
jgi:hypothetical protein